MTGTPPVLKKVSCNLQDACDGVASVLTFAELLATASQSPKHLQSSLRRRRKLLCKLQETIFRLYCTFNINKTSNPKNIP